MITRIKVGGRGGYEVVIGRGLAPELPTLAAGALAQHATQTQEDEHRQRQKDNGINIEHVSHAPKAAVAQTVRRTGQPRVNPRPPLPVPTRYT